MAGIEQEPTDIHTQIAMLDLLDHKEIDWQRVQSSAYLIHQHFRYGYPGPVRNLKQRLLIVPSDIYGSQRYIIHRLDVSAEVAESSSFSDEFGNRVIELLLPIIEQQVDFEAWIVVERTLSREPLMLPRSVLADPRYREASALTQPDETLREIAASLQAEARSPEELARRINEWVYSKFRYAHGTTGIHTTAAQALTLEQGVCQDFAHVMLALCRLCQLPARYVSGHLLGEGGTHAWVEVLLPSLKQADAAIALALDPTHNCETDLHYLTIAVGRDYYDVAPTSGTFQAPYAGQLTASKRVGPISLEYSE